MSYAETIIAFPSAIGQRPDIFFTRKELTQILDMYGRLVSAGSVRDYAISAGRGTIAFSLFRRASERPVYMVIKDPALKKKQGLFRIVAADGRILKRGGTLKNVLKVFEPKLMRLVKS